ncbi:heme exporter protein CcmB [Roseivirga pacifica]|uniref:heme exporter protein CcmB n=1 Tax=Roseivirga pacifica TaxID=1267423 RepID=UPI00227A8053|nr:heme exporter protein CcmB [Roseivirga pacifica]
MMKSSFFTLISKEFLAEWRQRYALNGMLLYIISTIFVCYLSFNIKNTDLQSVTWNALFWIIILFTSINSIAKSFIQENEGRLLYYYSLASPQHIILSKIVYYGIIMTILSFAGYFFYSFVMGNPIQDLTMFALVVLLASFGLSSALTMLSGIASKAPNSTSLIAILSFPVLLPLLLVIIKASKNAMDGINRSLYMDDILLLVAINAIIVAVSYMLFPYLWRS